MTYTTHTGVATHIAPPANIVGAPSPDADQFAAITERADLVASLARSIAEAAFRQDTTWLRLYRAEFRHHAVGVIEHIRVAAPIDGGRA
jgi:hypothetical protein